MVARKSRLSRSGRKLRQSRLDVIKKWVDIGYGGSGEGARSLDFRTEDLSPEDAAKVVRVVPGYNEFSGAAVSEAILKMRGHVSSIKFGRESSPVLYVHMPYWTHQVSGYKGFSGRRFSDAEEKANADFVMALLKKTKPDELDYDSGMHQIRAWWD